MKIKFGSDDLALNKMIDIHNTTIVVRPVFHKKKQILSASFLRWMPIWIINNIKMLCYDRIGISEGIDFNKTSKSKGNDICHYWYFLHKGFQFQQNVCNRCHDLLMMWYCEIAILNVKCSDYHGIISEISKKWGHKLNAKCWFDRKRWNITKHNHI